ncbi:MAG: NusA-like transcription termination signal-binding factor [Methanosarcinales archaeon]|uniref:Probable transcription termination protein NusA n=1 Tax=Candidatus Ethanoperedens thermophilum TaxID=2766897 RepID=A0A848DAZ5_9EURY|nr:NusA-like transcription termination signal-binding factor [Candidatus Ethanoperedens thermophilum]
MSEVKLDTDGMRYIVLFERITGASPIDCMIDDELNKVTFVVKSEDMGAAIGKGGDHVNRVKSIINKQIEIIEYSDDVREFIENVIQPVSIKNISIEEKKGKRIAYLNVSAGERGFAIGKGGRNISRVKMIVSRHHDIDEVIIQ